MFLKHLHLKNVRSIGNLDLDFAGETDPIRKWTLLLGQNGTGKSTVLRAAAMISCGSEALLELLGKPDTWIQNGQDRALLEATLLTAKQEERKISLVLQRGQPLSKLLAANQENLQQLDDALEHTSRNYLTIGYGASRRLPRNDSASIESSENLRSPRARSVATLFSPSASLFPLESWVLDTHYRFAKRGLSTIETTLNDLLPEVSFHSIDKKTKQVRFQTPDGLVPLQQLSDGYQNVASWVGDLVYRIASIYDDYKNPLASRGLLLIDEIDLHLHPIWQRKLREFLNDKLPNFQILATSHSPLTAQQSGPGELHTLRRSGTAARSVSIERYAGEPRSLLIHQLMLDPIFGLNTGDSRRVELLRQRHAELTQQKKRSVAERKELQKLQGELESLPSWSQMTPADQGQIALLKEMRSMLAQAKKVRK